MSIKGIDAYDAIGLSGLVAAIYGIAQWSEPAAIVLGGLAAFAFGILGPTARKGRT